VAVADVQPQRTRGLEHPRQAVHDEAQLVDPCFDSLLEADLPIDAVVTELEVRNAGDHAVDRGVPNVGQALPNITNQDPIPSRPDHSPPPASTESASGDATARISPGVNSLAPKTRRTASARVSSGVI